MDIVDESTHMIVAKARIALNTTKDLQSTRDDGDPLLRLSAIAFTLHNGPVPMYTEDGTKVGEVCAALDIRFKSEPQRTSFEQCELLADTDPGLLMYPLGFGDDPLRGRLRHMDEAWSITQDGYSHSALSAEDMSLLSAIQEVSNESHQSTINASIARREAHTGNNNAGTPGNYTAGTPGTPLEGTRAVPLRASNESQTADRKATPSAPSTAPAAVKRRTLMQESDDEVAAKVMRLINEDCAERARESETLAPSRSEPRQSASSEADVRASVARRALNYGTPLDAQAHRSRESVHNTACEPSQGEDQSLALSAAGASRTPGRHADLLDKLLSKGRQLMEKLDALATASPDSEADVVPSPRELSLLLLPHEVGASVLPVPPVGPPVDVTRKRTERPLSPPTSHRSGASSNHPGNAQQGPCATQSPLTASAARAAAGLSAGWDESTLRGEGPSGAAGSVRWSPFGGAGGLDDVCRSGFEEDSSLSPFSSPVASGKDASEPFDAAGTSGHALPLGGPSDGGRGSTLVGLLAGRGFGPAADAPAAQMARPAAQVPPAPGAAVARGGEREPGPGERSIVREVSDDGCVDQGVRDAAVGSGGPGTFRDASGGGKGAGEDEYGLEVHVAGVAVGRLELRHGDALCVDCVAPLPASAGDLVGDAIHAQVACSDALFPLAAPTHAQSCAQTEHGTGLRR